LTLATTVTRGGAGSRTAPPLLPWVGFAFLALTAQSLVIYGLGRWDQDADLLPALLFAAHLLLVPFLIKNFSLWGVRLLSAGLALNLLAMSLNGGLMPVGPEAVDAVGRHEGVELTRGEYIPSTKNVFLEPSETRAAFLSDSIILPIPRPLTRAVSPGDIVIAAGLLAGAAELLVRYRRMNQGDTGWVSPSRGQ
jgi:hypothetical protein